MIPLMRRVATRLTHHVYDLPVLVLMPHSRCNCRCVMCDIWKANQDKREISADVLERHLADLRKLGVRQVTLSGGEALMHDNLWTLCDLLKKAEIKISLLSTGITLQRHAAEVVKNIDDVIVSLDGPPEIHDAIRNIPHAFERLRDGVAALRQCNPSFPVAARTVIQKHNFRSLSAILDTARRLSLDRISFLPADVSSTAFNREQPWDQQRSNEVALSPDEAGEFSDIIEAISRSHAELFETGFVAESVQRLKAMVSYFKAIQGAGEFKSPPCNAPWVSAVVEANGDIRPCFFHEPYGNLEDGFERGINSRKAIAFREALDIPSNPICRRCVCSLKRGWI